MRPFALFKSPSTRLVPLMRMNGIQANDKGRRHRSVREAKRRERVVERVGRKTEENIEE